ncbi:MAG: PilZ domain-containing protein [Vallitaleaceae bacterium]|jgi:hypothetical protein|nr:PilZ domain-containing protein [Vallitaleaceae bacterium]
MKDDDSIDINDIRSRERFTYRDDILCFKNIGLDNTVENRAPLKIVVENISYSGIGIICSRPVTVGSMLVFNINNGQEVREMMLEVKWCQRKQDAHHAGLQFIGLKRPDIYFLHEMVNKSKKENNKN